LRRRHLHHRTGADLAARVITTPITALSTPIAVSAWGSTATRYSIRSPTALPNRMGLAPDDLRRR
jgi:hypothetical protein